jgi:hypothetical protein
MAKTAIVHSQQRWEYQSIVRRTESSLEKELNEMGQVGWELVSIDHAKDRKGEMAWTAFLKRPAAPPGQPGAGQEQAAAASPQPAAEPARAEPAKAESSGAREGFDLSGDEFAIREE